MQLRNSDRKKIVISPEAKEDLKNILSFLTENWGDQIVQEFLQIKYFLLYSFRQPAVVWIL